VAVEILATVVIAGAIAATGLHQPVSVLFSRGNAPEPYALAFLTASLAMAWIFFGFESAADVAEEVVHPGRHVPRAMISSLLWAGVVTAIVVAALILGARDLRTAAADPAQAIPLILGDHFGPGGLRLLVGFVVFAFFSCAAAIQAAAARLVFSYARDGQVPGSEWLRGVSSHGVPARAMLFTAGVAAVVTAAAYVDVGAVNANALLVSYAVAGIYVAFQAVMLARLIAGARGWRPEGEFTLGRWSRPAAAGALAYGVLMLVNLCWPRPMDQPAGWLTLASVLAVVVPGALIAARRRP
jgi:amino acid transporter